jgi:pilus assembly protein CpaC
MSKKQQIREVFNEKDTVVRINRIEGNTRTILLTGLTPGISRMQFTGEDGSVETIDVIVQLDIEFLKNLLGRAVPTAVVTPIAGAGNTIILTGTVSHAEDVETIMGIARSITATGTTPPNIINAMRVGGVMQVQLDVVVARVNRREARLMSVDIFDAGVNHFLKSSTGGIINVPTSISGTLPGAPTITSIIAGNGVNGQLPNVTFGIFNNKQAVFVWLQALRINNLAKLLAEPHLVTLSGRAATFVSGGEQAVPQVSGFGGTAGVEFVPFGTTLNFLPIVLGNGKIYLEVEPEVSALDQASGVLIPGGGIVPGRTTQRVRTAVTIETGQTLAIGGLIQRVTQASTVKTPILGDLPFLGVFFSTKTFDENEEEMIVLVTPHLVDPMDCKQVPNFVPGQETRSPDDFELFLEGILEAPRGPRNVCPGGRYLAPHKNSATISVFPCGDNGNGGNGGTYSGCRSGCATPVARPTLPAAVPNMVYEMPPNREEVLPVGGDSHHRGRPVEMELASPLPDEYR